MIPTSGEQTNEPPLCVGSKATQKLRRIPARFYNVEQRMTHKCYIDPRFLIEFGFEGKDHNHLVHQPFDLVDSPGSPRPDLRADVIQDWNPSFSEVSRQTEIEIWEIDQDGKV
jgi:hypothetical protein